MRDNGDDDDSDSVADDGLPQVRVAMKEGNNNEDNMPICRLCKSRAEPINRSSQINQHAANAASSDRWLAPNNPPLGWYLTGGSICPIND